MLDRFCVTCCTVTSCQSLSDWFVLELFVVQCGFKHTYIGHPMDNVSVCGQLDQRPNDHGGQHHVCQMCDWAHEDPG
jgi:hypothetical protein